jgi:hypothetical protein
MAALSRAFASATGHRDFGEFRATDWFAFANLRVSRSRQSAAIRIAYTVHSARSNRKPGKGLRTGIAPIRPVLSEVPEELAALDWR